MNFLPDSVVMVDSWQVLGGDRFPADVMVLINSRWLNYIRGISHLKAIDCD